MGDRSNLSIAVILLDYGGVLAEEGFREGLMELGKTTDIGPEEFFQRSAEAVYDSGYVVGKAEEPAFWDVVRERTGIRASDEGMREEIMTRFTLRPWMITLARELKNRGYTLAILSDQTQWLDDLDTRDDFFRYFDRVFNSYYLGKGKRDATIFPEVAQALGVEPGSVLFVDDNEGHIQRARAEGLQTILFKDREDFLDKMNDAGFGEVVKALR